ncbi:amino acid deaminase [Pseudomonas sp. Q1-7]|uniref:amino acid deaminase n=1 Tax=Pseudomonas sp. Q1-7 TaxID=3020843 RepID=UPI002300B8B5|nr:amino acid deaminase [Pseudomonas sp. Q1-7]
MAENKNHVPMLNQRTKGLGRVAPDCTLDAVGALGWRILDEDVSLPVAVLLQSRIEHNLAWMSRFIRHYGVQLAPHGKTTMSPALFHLQLQHGAWGITLATAPQVQAAHAHGIRRVLLANQLVGKANMAIVSDLQRDPDFSFCCLVDSATNIDALGRHFAEAGQTIRVLLEYGVAGGRTGLRSIEQEHEALSAIRRWPQSVRLVGTELYEGVLQDETQIRQLLRHVLERTRQLAAEGRFAEPDVILSGAGSAWFDVVAEEFAQQSIGQPLNVILRPGCYLTHDAGIYREAERRIQAHNAVAREMGRSLLPALQLWANVQSRPEPGLAIIAMGKRDAAFDAGLPLATLHHRPGTGAGPAPAPADWRVTKMMDQHAFMAIPDNADLRVGDMLAFDISHPCLTFDKWRQLLLVDDDYRVTGAIETLF